MASVQELIAAAEHEANVSSPLASVLKNFLGGYQQADQGRIDRNIKLMQLEKMRQEAEQTRAAMEYSKAERAKLNGEADNAIKFSFGAVHSPTPVTPQQKQELKKKTTVDERGGVTHTYETVEPKDDSPKSLDAYLTKQVTEGKMTLDEALEKKSKSSGGVSPSLLYQMQKDEEKKAEVGKSKTIPGYQSTGEVAIDEIEARKLREAVSEFATFNKGLTEYKNLIEKHGTVEILDRKTSGKMEAYAKNLQLKVKNLAQLGVLSISDIPFIEKQIPSPGVFKTSEGMLGALNAAEEVLKNAVEEKLKVSGYSKIGESAATSTKSTQTDGVPKVGETFMGKKVLSVKKVR